MSISLIDFGFSKNEERAVSDWLITISELYGAKALGEVHYQALGAVEMVERNRELLSHDYCTDVITIPYDYLTISFEAFVCPEFVVGNARDWGLDPVEELHRVIAHALLHMLGFDDVAKDQQEEMRAAEDKCLILRPKILKHKT